MAKTTAPLLSFGGLGQIGKSVVFSVWRGVTYARQYTIPSNPKTAAQTSTRTTFKTLQSIWLRLGPFAQNVWSKAASGRPYTDRNRHTQVNLPLMRGQADCQDYLGSPGVAGGPPLTGMVAAGGGASGEIDVDFTVSAVPDGWTLVRTVAMAFVDQDPETVFSAVITEDEATVAPWDITLSGLVPNTLHVVTGWQEFTKPDGSFAASIATTTTATSTA